MKLWTWLKNFAFKLFKKQVKNASDDIIDGAKDILNRTKADNAFVTEAEGLRKQAEKNFKANMMAAAEIVADPEPVPKTVDEIREAATKNYKNKTTKKNTSKTTK